MNTNETANRILGCIDSAMTVHDNGLFRYAGVEDTSHDPQTGDLIVHVKLRDDPKTYLFRVTCTPEVEGA